MKSFGVFKRRYDLIDDAGVGPISELTSRVISASVAPWVRYESASMIASRTAPGFRFGWSEYFMSDNRRLDVFWARTNFPGVGIYAGVILTRPNPINSLRRSVVFDSRFSGS